MARGFRGLGGGVTKNGKRQLRQALEQAWKSREVLGVSERAEAYRAFHGPGESQGVRGMEYWAVDLFGGHAWLTSWEGPGAGDAGAQAEVASGIAEFLEEREVRSAVWLRRPERAVPEDPRALFGKPPGEGERFACREGRARFWIQLLGAKHPGLFLDHEPLRAWLMECPRGARVLNAFSYTASLSVAAALGGAQHVTSLDLSKPITEWARQNWELNGLEAERGDFIYGDVFEWFPKLERQGRRYDCVILDPPSFSRGKSGGRFSTSNDLRELHRLALGLLPEEGGTLVTSINSANVSWEKYAADVAAAARDRGFALQVLRRIDLPESFPTRLERLEDRYLKGWCLRAIRTDR